MSNRIKGATEQFPKVYWTRDRRFSYALTWAGWEVTDHASGRKVVCQSRRAALRWIKAARVFEGPSQPETGPGCNPQDDECTAPDPRFCRVGWHRDRAETKDKD